MSRRWASGCSSTATSATKPSRRTCCTDAHARATLTQAPRRTCPPLPPPPPHGTHTPPRSTEGPPPESRALCVCCACAGVPCVFRPGGAHVGVRSRHGPDPSRETRVVGSRGEVRGEVIDCWLGVLESERSYFCVSCSESGSGRFPEIPQGDWTREGLKQKQLFRGAKTRVCAHRETHQDGGSVPGVLLTVLGRGCVLRCTTRW